MAATDFKGYLVKFGNVEVPNSLIKMDDGNESTPNHREDIKAERDDYTRTLHRVTSNGKITNFSLVFRQMNIRQRRALKNVMASGLVNDQERKYRVTYWNDENLQYEVGDFYIPDITYKRKMVTNNDLVYGEFTMEFIAYSNTVATEG